MKKEKNIKRVFTSEETLNIFKDLLLHNKVTNDTYLLFGLWTSNVMGQSWTGMFRRIIGEKIDVFNFHENSDYYKDIMQDAITLLITDNQNKTTGKWNGLKHKVNFEKVPIKSKNKDQFTPVEKNLKFKPIVGNERQVIQYLKTCFKNCLYQAINKNIRQGVSTSTAYALKKNLKMLELKKVIDNEDDKSLVNLDLITELKLKGFTDNELYRYRLAYYSGDLSNFTNLDNIVIEKNYNNLTNKLNISADRLQKQLYESVYEILESKKIPFCYREFLRAFYQIPITTTLNGTTITYYENITNFLSKFPEYNDVFRVKREFYVGGKKCIKFKNKTSLEDIKKTSIYKESHQYLLDNIKPLVEDIIFQNELIIYFEAAASELYAMDNYELFFAEEYNIEPEVDVYEE